MMDGARSTSIDALLAQVQATGTAERVAQCCCGRPQCAFLAYNSVALEGLEKDLVSAAQIGQALLVRHQSHMAESEAERMRMSDTIDQLEVEKRTLESDNAKKIEENRELLDRLEELNHQVSDSDAQVQSLTASLQVTQQELQRLTVLTQRASSLEAQLLALESEHSQLQTEFASTEEGQRSALQRWRRAEATIGELQSQIDQIEREAKEERERHIEVIDRMERTRAVERELDSAAGRLKSAAATALDRHHNNGQVVSHFVRDILQDNANLQSGVVELRELLLSSNVEVETLREQLRVHRPVEENDGALTTLNHELKENDTWADQPSSNADTGSLHVHHHYHAPNITVRKQKKKRTSVSSSQASGPSTPRASRIKDWRANTPSSFATILSQTAASVPASHQNRWSTQSTNTLSSFASSDPSSPRHTGSIFDTIEAATEISQPTTPASSMPGSPALIPSDITPRKLVPRSASGPLAVQLKSRPSLGELSSVRLGDSGHDHIVSPAEPITPFGTETILEESEHTHNDGSSYLDELASRPRLRRAASHESLFSISGMDIHTLYDRPSQLLFGGAFSPRGPTTNSFASSLSPQAATSHETARPAFNGRGSESSDHARSLLHSVHSRPGMESRPSLTKKVGGWVWSKWGVTPAAASNEQQTKSQPQRPFMRPVGINQKGPIPGLGPPPKTPSQVETNQIDSALLRESLGDMLVREDLGI